LGKMYVIGGSKSVVQIFIKHYLGDQIKENQMSRTCSRNGGDEICKQDLRVHGGIILKWILIRCDDRCCIHLIWERRV